MIWCVADPPKICMAIDAIILIVRSFIWPIMIDSHFLYAPLYHRIGPPSHKLSPPIPVASAPITVPLELADWSQSIYPTASMTRISHPPQNHPTLVTTTRLSCLVVDHMIVSSNNQRTLAPQPLLILSEPPVVLILHIVGQSNPTLATHMETPPTSAHASRQIVSPNNTIKHINKCQPTSTKTTSFLFGIHAIWTKGSAWPVWLPPQTPCISHNLHHRNDAVGKTRQTTPTTNQIWLAHP